MIPGQKNDDDRFWEKIKIDGQSGCWNWIATKNQDGYGRFRLHGTLMSAHRYAYARFIGEIGELYVLHKCDNPSCVNPEHLFLGDHSANMLDMYQKKRHGKYTPIGENAPWHKLNEKDVKDIRSTYEHGGISQARLGKQYGVSTGTIQAIVERRNWKHI